VQKRCRGAAVVEEVEVEVQVQRRCRYDGGSEVVSR